jgi:integrase
MEGASGKAGPDALVFGTRTGTAISRNNVLRRAIFPACDALELPRASWLTFRRTYSSWSHDKGAPGKVVAQLMGHANVDTTLNVYTQGARWHAAERRRDDRPIVHDCSPIGRVGGANALKCE